MHKILILSDFHKNHFSSWLPWLSSAYEVTQIKLAESLQDVVDAWSPHILLTLMKSDIYPQISQTIFNRNRPRIGWIAFSEQYNLKDEIRAFQNGADHYLLLSTPIESLKLRIQALTEKIDFSTTPHAQPLAHLPTTVKTLRSGFIELHLDRQILMVDGQFRLLTPTQFKLLELFLSHGNLLLTREYIKETVFRKKEISLRSIDAHIAKLKKTVPELKSKIVNQYGRGYVFVTEQVNAA